MTTTLITRGLAFVLVGLALAACSNVKPEPNRGTFGPAACDQSTRQAVGDSAVLAVYFDKDGKEVGTTAESLHGTVNNTMCPAPELEGGAGCPAGKCPIFVPRMGTSYCGPCLH